MVDFPAPLRPSSATVSPRRISRSIPSTARTAPNVLTAPVKDTAGSVSPSVCRHGRRRYGPGSRCAAEAVVRSRAVTNVTAARPGRPRTGSDMASGVFTTAGVLGYTWDRRTRTRSRTGAWRSTRVPPAQQRPRCGRRCGRPHRGLPRDQGVSCPMPIDAAKAVAAEPRTAEITWDHKDVQLYHLGLGAGTPRHRPRRTALHPRDPGCTSCPASPPSPAPEWASSAASPPPASTSTSPRVLHGGQSVDLHRPIPVKGSATSNLAASPPSTTRARPPSSSCAPRSPTTDGPLWTSDAQIFVRGEGGFGGDRGPSARLEAPDRRTRPHRRAPRPRGPGAALPALRRLEPAARRPGVRQARRLRPADPARPVLVRHDAQGGRRHAARRRRGPRAVLRAPGSPGSSSRARRCASGCGARDGPDPGRRSPPSSGTTRRYSPTPSSNTPDAHRRRPFDERSRTPCAQPYCTR